MKNEEGKAILMFEGEHADNHTVMHFDLNIFEVNLFKLVQVQMHIIFKYEV